MDITKIGKDFLRPLYYKLTHPRVKKLCMGTMDELESFRNRYKGKRCFIVGNGPSLRMDDLDAIKNEYTFGMNRIYMLFDRTCWRPTFYSCQDPTIVRSCHDEIQDYVTGESIIFIKPTGQRKYDIKNALYFDMDYKLSNKRKLPGFLSHQDENNYTLNDGLTSVYSAMQIAAYMGFSEIYLLGVDCNYSENNDRIQKSSYPDERMYDSKKVGMPPEMDYLFKVYGVAKKYFEMHNIIVKNATRGGKLEIFDRINFDDLIGASDEN